MVICSAYGCRSRSDRNEPEITYYRFPLKEPQRTRLWVQNMHLADWEPNKNSRLCSKHFPNSLFYSVGAKTCLPDGGVPTVFEELPQYMQKIEPKKKATKRHVEENLPTPSTSGTNIEVNGTPTCFFSLLIY